MASTSVRCAADGGRLSFSTIALTVGPPDNNRTFDVDVDPILIHSRFFARMLAGPWLESQTRATLPDDDPDVFSLFARFIYTGKICSSQSNDVQVYPDGSRRDLEWPRLARAWILGDKLQSTSFKDAVTDAICENMAREKKWPTTLHQVIYPNTTSAARGIRRLCVEIAVSKWEARTLRATLKDEEWGAFFWDVAVRLMGMREKEKTGKVDFEDAGCRYHAHVAEGTDCWRKVVFGLAADAPRAM